MTPTQNGDPRVELAALHAKLIGWLLDHAYPCWAKHGIDPATGAFIEAIGQDGLGLALPRRARVQPRQVYAFAQAPRLGWRGEVTDIVRRGIEHFTAHYRRGDGLFSTLASIDGTVLDERALLYDQAFALLGFASAATLLDERRKFEKRALDLHAAILRNFGTLDAALRSETGAHGIRESNPHMHLLEACLAWAEIGADSLWAEWAHKLAELAVRRFIRPDTGALGEAFTAEWHPAPGLPGRIVEPGHQFEWAWLLLRCESSSAGEFRQTARNLLAIGESSGVRDGFAVNALVEDLTIQDPNSRLWPQTERLKSAVLAAEVWGDVRYCRMACAAASSLLTYLDTPVPGLWYDLRLAGGELVDSPAPASTFYHVVGAICALDKAIREGGRHTAVHANGTAVHANGAPAAPSNCE